jgi:uncharacterized cupredoxin-like copper-binding protein
MKRLLSLVMALLVMVCGCADGLSIPGLTSEQLVVTSFDADPLKIAPGESSTLSWTVQGATRVEIDPDVGSVALSGSRVVSPTTTTVYTLTATNAAGKTTSVTVQVVVSGASSPGGGLPSIASFVASPTTISAGGSATLSWSVSNATEVTIEPGLGTFALSGSTSVSPASTTTYILLAENASGKTTATAVVTVSGTSPAGLPDVEHFSATPSVIADGDSSTLTWAVSGTGTVSIDHGIGAVAPSGTKSVSPSSTTTYTLTATNATGSVHETVTVVVEDEEPEGEPDLVITAIAKVAASGGYRIGYTIKNQGDSYCASSTSKLYVGGVYKASDTVPALAAGASANRQFSSWTYDPTNHAVKVVADANDVVDEEDEDNNEKAVSVAAEVLVDFVNVANLADWKSGNPETDLSFGGSTSDSNGFACYRTSIKLEDGATYSKVLETHPKWVASGWIDGFYPVLTVPLGAWLVADVGFINGATGSDGVTFRVWFWQDGSDIPSVLDDVDAEYDGDLDRLEINLSSLVGRMGRIGLQVLAGASSGQDWAVWSSVKMIR